MMCDELKHDDEMEQGACVGTFRWKSDKRFPTLPPLAESNGASALKDASLFQQYLANSFSGWGGYFAHRSTSTVDVARAAHEDLSLVDGLSFPLSLAFGLHAMGVSAGALRRMKATQVDVVVLGASFKAEVRVAKQTHYWEELSAFFPGVAFHLWMVGPEAIDADGSEGASHWRMNESISVSAISGTYRSWKAKYGDASVVPGGSQADEPTSSARAFRVLMAFNPGFGSGSAALLRSWLPDLKAIAKEDLPFLVTQANDYSDLRGELAVWQRLIGARFALSPMPNPMSMAVTTIAEHDTATAAASAGAGKGAWSCGNAYIYCVQGRTIKATEQPPSHTDDQVNKLAKALQAVGNAHPSDPQAREISFKLKLSTEEVRKSLVVAPALRTPARGGHLT